MSDVERSLVHSKLLGALPADRIADLDQRVRWRAYEPEQTIIVAEDEGTDVYFVIKGEVRVTVYSETGKTVIISDLKAGDHFGEYAAIDGRSRSASIVALNRTLVAAMPASMFHGLLETQPEIARDIMRGLAGAVRGLVERVVEFSTLGVRNRIHAELLRLARAGRVVDGAGRVSPPPTHAEIAARISTHREAVTRELNQLERDGMLERTKGALVIRDLGQLAEMVENARAGRS
ncbi:MAG: Crp/Fnr family transcriptional regulator [Rhodospirillaceae bacterium]|nr:Crp/Fnr family transcriptional regulator [Rhodospirillaceae bacterium]